MGKGLKYIALLCVMFFVKTAVAQVDSIVWDFTSGTTSAATNLTWANFTCSEFTAKGVSTSVNSTTAVGSSSNGTYTPSSKGNNMAVLCISPDATLNPSTAFYVEWTMTPDPGKQITLGYIEFGVRSTSTGAAAWSLRSSKDGYATDLVTPGTIATDGKWALKKTSLTLPFEGGVGKAITFRLFLYNATAKPTATSQNVRFDDIKIRTARSTKEPKIRVLPRELPFATATGVPNNEVFTVQGLLLEQNVSVSSTSPRFTVDKSSVSYAAANAAAQTVTVTFDGSANNATGKIVLSTIAGGNTITDTVRLTGTTSASASIRVSIPSTGKIDFPPITVGGLTTQMIEITGRSLTDSIVVVSPRHAAFTVSAAKLRKNANQDYLFLYYRPTAKEVVNDTLILRSKGVADVVLPIHANAVKERTDLLPPTDYYNSAINKTGAELKTALYNKIKGHTIVPYSEAWTAYGWLDIRSECDLYMPDASVWDIYTDRPGCLPDNSACVPNFKNPTGTRCAGFKVLRIGTDQTSSTNPGGSEEGKSYEREHTFPKGWWAAAKNSGGAYREVSPMYCDLFHLYPCDHRVNNLRNDNPYGEVSVPTANGTFTNGSKLGVNVASGAPSTTAYEPIDEYKGDIARNYFYMVTRYENTVQHWSKNITWGGDYYDEVVAIAPGLHGNASPMIDTNSYPVFKPWAHQMLLKWHRLDPVSEKELMRNQTIYAKYQYNRNPFIDHPELVEYIWGDSIGKKWKGVEVDTTVLHASIDEIAYAHGKFNIAAQVLYAKNGVSSVKAFFGEVEGDTTLGEYILTYLNGAYRANFIPTFDFQKVYITLEAIDGAGRRVTVTDEYEKPALTVAVDDVAYSSGIFNVSANVYNAVDGVKLVMCYLGATPSDTSLHRQTLAYSDGVYASSFTSPVSLDTSYLTFVAVDSASRRAEVSYIYVAKPLSIEVENVTYSGGQFAVSARVLDADGGVKSVMCYLGTAAGDTSLHRQTLAYNNGIYASSFAFSNSKDTTYLTFIVVDGASRRAEVAYTYVARQLGIEVQSLTYSGGKFSISTRVLNADGGVRGANCFVGRTEGDTTVAKYALAYSNGVYKAAFLMSNFDTLYFTCEVYDLLGRRAVAKQRHVQGGATAVEAVTADLNFTLYPNPARDVVYIRLEDNITRAWVELFNANGVLVKSGYAGAEPKLGLSGFMSGIYFVRVITDARTGVRRFTIER